MERAGDRVARHPRGDGWPSPCSGRRLAGRAPPRLTGIKSILSKAVYLVIVALLP
jgi:hypothetical protein